jgi:glycerol-3-phosphate dehydrogenase
VLGTTDTPIDNIEMEPKPLEEEIAFILKHINRYVTTNIQRSDVKSVYVGLRPLVKTKAAKQTALLSRDHTLVVSTSGLVTITGGKWTTYRKMAEDAVENAVFISKQGKIKCITKTLQIGDPEGRSKRMAELIIENPQLSNKIHPLFPQTKADIVYAVRYEMAVTIEDFLARRCRILFLDAQAAKESSGMVSNIMANELGKDDKWIEQEMISFQLLANQYLLS